MQLSGAIRFSTTSSAATVPKVGHIRMPAPGVAPHGTGAIADTEPMADEHRPYSPNPSDLRRTSLEIRNH